MLFRTLNVWNVKRTLHGGAYDSTSTRLVVIFGSDNNRSDPAVPLHILDRSEITFVVDHVKNLCVQVNHIITYIKKNYSSTEKDGTMFRRTREICCRRGLVRVEITGILKQPQGKKHSWRK